MEGRRGWLKNCSARRAPPVGCRGVICGKMATRPTINSGVMPGSTLKRIRLVWASPYFFVGPGVGRDDGLRSTEYLGIWVSHAQVLALLPESAAASASVTWARATTRSL